MPILGSIASSYRSSAAGPATFYLLDGYTMRGWTSTTGTSWTAKSTPTYTASSGPDAYGYGAFYLNNNRILFGYSPTSGGSNNGMWTSTNATSWTLAKYDTVPSSFGATSSYDNFIYANGNYWATDGNYRIYNSTDLVTWNWQSVFSNVNEAAYGLAYGASTYVVTGYVDPTGTIKGAYYSTNGTTWTATTIGNGGGAGANYYKTIYGDKFVAAGTRNDSVECVQTSTNGITWTTRTTPFLSSQLQGVAYNPTVTNKYVIITADNTRTYYSTDAITWTNTTTAFVSTPYFITATNGIYIVGDYSSYFFTSTNGTTWTSRTLPNSASYYGNAAYDGTRYIMPIYNPGANTTCYITTDFTTWTTSGFTGNTDVPNSMYRMAYGNNLYLAVGQNGVYQSSTDMVTWTRGVISQTQSAATGLNGVIYDGTKWLVVDGYGQILTSTTGTSSWTLRYTQSTNSTFNTIWYEPKNTEKYYAAGSNGCYATSTDGITWTTRSDFAGNYSIFLIRSNPSTGFLVASAGSGQIYYSTDGITWTQTSTGTGSLANLIYSNNTWVVQNTSYNSLIYSSTNGISWTSRTNPFSSAGSNSFGPSFRYAWAINNMFVIFGRRANGLSSIATGAPYITSTDGITWTSRVLAADPNGFWAGISA